MNAYLMKSRWSRGMSRILAAVLAGAALAVSAAPMTYAEAPSPAAGFEGATPLVGPGAGDLTVLPFDADAGVAESPSVETDPWIVPPSGQVRPTRVWTTNRYGWHQTTFYRGEVIVFWVQLYNPSRYYALHDLELWVDDHIRCVTTPCDGGPQRLFAGRLYVRPGLTNYYLVARAEASDKVGEWAYYATDPQQRTHVATRFFLR